MVSVDQHIADYSQKFIEELKTLALELQEMVQAKVGTTKFATVYGRIRQQVVGIRRERKVDRAVQVWDHCAGDYQWWLNRDIGHHQSGCCRKTEVGSKFGEEGRSETKEPGLHVSHLRIGPFDQTH